MDVRHPLLARLAEELAAAAPVPWRKHRVELILGTDREIGREKRSVERRVAVTPDQVADLCAFFAALRVDLDVLVLHGAGRRAGFADADYIHAGAEILTEEELAWHDAPPDVFHALKEPSRYEARVPTPFCRLGALHTGAFHPDGGLASLLATRDVAIFDGSSIGASGDRRIPIRGRMSEFAGRIGAGWIADHLDYRRLGGPVVVVGAGRAGSAAAERLLAEPAERVVLLHLFDLPDQRERLAGAFEDPRVRIHALDPERRDDAELVAALEGAAGVLFAVAVPQGKAPRVVSLDALRRHTDPRAMVVDVSIDERGAIHDPSLTESWELRRVIRHFESQLAPRRYRSVDNMPRTLPREASPAHGEVVLPYLAALLLLAAREGGFEPLMEHLGGLAVDLHAPDPATAPEGRRLDAYAQDLRNGLAFWPRRLKAAPTSRRLAVEDVVADRQGVLGFLFGQGVPCEFSVRPRDAASEPAKLREDYRYLPAPIRSSLERAVDLGIDGRVIYHPDIDGTQARYAALALGVRRSHVLKTMIVRNGDGRYLAAICEGDRELDLERIAELLGVAEVAMASPEEVREVTQHPPGGVPVLEVFGMDGVHPVLVSRGLLDHEWVVGSGGSEFVGLQINPAVLQRLKGRVEDITTPPSPP